MARIIDEPLYPRPAVHPPRPVVARRTAIPVSHPPRWSVVGGAGGAPATGGGTGGGGGTPAGPPDYLALIKGTPAYQSWLNSRNARMTDLATSRAQAIRALALQFGGLPGNFKDAFGDLRPEDIAAARGNQFSAMNDIARQDAQARTDAQRSLAARGMLQSGDLGFANEQQDLSRGHAEYDAANQFLAALNQAISGYTSGVGAIGAEEPGIISGLLPYIQQLYPYNPGAGGGTTPAPGAAPAVGAGTNRPLAPVAHATRAVLTALTRPRTAQVVRRTRPRVTGHHPNG